MFIQVIRARVVDPEGIRAEWDRWASELAPGATGWLGSTTGISTDDEFVTIARFESEAAAKANSERSEQGRWWEEAARFIENDFDFYDCPRVDQMLGGANERAGFVQLIQGTASDEERMRSLNAAMEPILTRDRPELLGSLISWHGTGKFIETMYFTNEAEARAGEGREFPGGLHAFLDELSTLIGAMEFVDLVDPWHHSP